jgi:2'-5' RNA ligase
MRLFAAILLSDEIRRALADAQRRLRPVCEGVRWVEPALLHLTIKFLGEVPDGRVSSIAAGLRSAVAELAPFDMAVAGCGCFPPRGDVRVIWAGVHEPDGLLAGCARAIDEQMATLGFAVESRPFAAHVTLGRLRDDPSRGRMRDRVAAVALPAGLSQRVEAVSLMASTLSSTGPSYATVATAPLTHTKP